MRLDSKPWFFIALVTVAIGVSYFDRQALPVAISAIQRNIPISDAQFALLQAAFLATYALLYASGGKFLDTIGTEVGFAVSMAWWSVACSAWLRAWPGAAGAGSAWARARHFLQPRD